MNLAGPILRHAMTSPDAPALIEGGSTMSYRELADRVARTARHLIALGLARGDRLGLCLRDTAAHVATLLAAARIGAVAVPLDWRAKAPENARLLQWLDLKLVLAEVDVRLPAECPALVLDAAWHDAVSVIRPGELPTTDWSEPFLIAATSGSSGAPKLTQLTHLQFFFRIVASLEVMGLAGRQRYLSTLPLYYSGGRTRCLAHLLRGDCVILYPSLLGPAEYVEQASRWGVTAGYLVPSMVRQLLASAGDGDQPLLPKLVSLFSTGAPLYAEEKRQAARKLTPNFHEEYGAAEIGCLTVLRPAALASRADSVGQPHSLVEIEVVDDDDRPLPPDGVGRIRFRGPALGSPIGEPGKEHSRDTPHDRWHSPGEIGRLDELGYLYILGRTSDVIMRGGAKVYPAEVESSLLEHPEVVEAAVVGRRGADNEEEVMAFVVARRPLEAGTLIAHCRSRLTPHKVPRQIRFVPQLPRNATGKIDKTALATGLE
jgi:acyl-coenzyme A synthetase/AMP-(fatty) acid ligase